MNQLVNLNQNNQTMSSREIAELTGKEHRNVMRDIRAMLVELHGEGGVLNFEHTYVNQQNGQSYPCFNLPKRETLILVSGYNTTMRAAIIDRWQELEGELAQAPQVSTKFTPIQLLAQCVETIQEQMEIIKTVEDKNAKLTKTANAHINTTDLAKHLKQYCAKKSLVSRCNSTNVLQAAIDCGLLERTGKNEYKATELMLSEGFGATLGYSYPHWDMRVTNHLPFTMALSRIINK